MADSQQPSSYEVEMKFRVPQSELTTIHSRLQQMDARQLGAADEADTYFNHPSRDFAQTDEAFRIRVTDGQVRLTYKGPKIDATTKTRREIEIPLDGTADIAPLCDAMLTALGFRRVATVRKHRRRYALRRGEHEVEIALDEVTRVGTFVELEIVVDRADIEQAKACVLELATALGLGDSERRSYLHLLLLANQNGGS